MRVNDRHIRATRPPVEISFAGKTISGYEGESLAACLTANGVRGFRTTKSGVERGIFCGMGVCSECLVEVVGRSSLNACMTPLVEGMVVEPHVHARTLSGTVPVATETAIDVHTDVLTPDILVLGGGPAGLSAAKAAAMAGCEVVLVDERPSLGGQYYKQLLKAHVFDDSRRMDRQFQAGGKLIAEVEAAGVKIYRSAMIWGAFEPREVCVLVEGHSLVFQPANIIVATGAYERGVPVPGWTLPGYMTTGAAQTLLRSYRVSPGKRILLAGNGPLNLQVASELTMAGVEVAAVAEAAPLMSAARLPAILRAFRQSPDLIFDGMNYLRMLVQARVPVLYGHVVVGATGNGCVEQVTVAKINASGEINERSRREFDVDAVCVGYGFLPSNDVSRALNCQHRVDPLTGGLVAGKDDDGLSSAKNVYIAGDCGGLGGASAAIEDGFIAGAAAARSLGRELPGELKTELDASRRRRLVARRFQKALWEMFAAPQVGLQLAKDDTLVCRCEEVTLRELKETLDGGTSTAGAIKRQTRAGMGLCQGRYCGSHIATLVAEQSGVAMDEYSFFAPRPPIKPVPIHMIARETSDGITPETFEGTELE